MHLGKNMIQTRAWVFQESLLSPWGLRYAAQQMECLAVLYMLSRKIRSSHQITLVARGPGQPWMPSPLFSAYHHLPWNHISISRSARD